MSSLHFVGRSEIPHCTAIVDKRFVGYSSLQLVYRGAVTLRYNSKAYTLHAPYVWPCNPGPHVYFEPLKEEWHHFHVAATGPQLDQWRSEGLWPEQPIPVNDVEELVNKWRTLLPLVDDKDPWQQRRAINILESILLDCRPKELASPEATWLREAKTALEQGLDQNAVAKQLGLGVSTFRRHFTESLGICPQDWAVQHRIDQARNLLRDTDMAIKDIAMELDFYDAAHFTKQFKQRVGLSPRAYRNSSQFI